MENIKIDKFLTIQKVDIPLKKVNIFIGPQAQGKSVIAKLIKLTIIIVTKTNKYICDIFDLVKDNKSTESKYNIVSSIETVDINKVITRFVINLFKNISLILAPHILIAFI